jgi:hypothetical protein
LELFETAIIKTVVFYLCVHFRNIIIFYGEELLAPRPTPKLEGHHLSAVRDCLFNIFTASLQNWRDWVDNIKMDLREIG